MRFENTSQVLRFYAAVRNLGPVGAASECSDDMEDPTIKNLVYGGESDPKAWAKIVHEMVDIENALNRVFHGKRKWIHDVLICWAVDGYVAAVNELACISPFHKCRCQRTHESDLASFIGEITDELIRIRYLKKDTNPSNDLTFFDALIK
jgi:hypothetical protein